MPSEEVQYLTEPWADCLDLAGRELVALVGAGGKTSLLFALARELALAGQRVVVTTTTRIFHPQGLPVNFSEDPVAAASPLPGEILILARGQEETADGVKLIGYDPAQVDRLWLAQRAEYLLVEADGARGRPIKAPRDHEPAVPAEATTVVGVIGLSALGRPLGPETVFAPEEFGRLAGLKAGQEVTPEAAVRLILSSQGLFKAAPVEAGRVVFLNQADDESLRQAGLSLIQHLARQELGLRAVLGSLRTGRREVFDLA